MERTTHDVFAEAVQDNLNGTPHASHPVQFEESVAQDDDLYAILPNLVGCTLCGAVVFDTERWRDLHRENHDKHNQVHAAIEHEARRYKSPPRYG
jgi:hypothetical protein